MMPTKVTNGWLAAGSDPRGLIVWWFWRIKKDDLRERWRSYPLPDPSPLNLALKRQNLERRCGTRLSRARDGKRGHDGPPRAPEDQVSEFAQEPCLPDQFGIA